MNAQNLKIFKNMLEEKKVQILDNIQHNIQEMGSRNQSDLSDEADLASSSSDNFTEQILTQQQNTELTEVEAALEKIAKNNYGICEMCDEEIQIERLKVKTFAKFCIDCRKIYEKIPN
jgi:DnaK suppressor protein